MNDPLNYGTNVNEREEDGKNDSIFLRNSSKRRKKP